MSVRITPAITPLGLRVWVRFPKRQIYARSSAWIAPLDQDLLRLLDATQNPSFCNSEVLPLLARDSYGRVVGRLLVHVNHRHNVRHGERVAFFGFFECINDEAVARALIDAAAAFGRERGCTQLRGPFGPTLMHELGILTDGFELAPSLDESYSAPYYGALFAAVGLQPSMRMTTFRLEPIAACAACPSQRAALEAPVENHRLRIRQPDARSLDHDIEIARDILNDSFYEDPNFVPLSSEEWHFQIDPLRRLIDYRIVHIAELDGVPVGFVLCVPDLGQLLRPLRGHVSPLAALRLFRDARHVRSAVLTLMCVRRHLHGQGIMRTLLTELAGSLEASAYESLTVTWVAEQNTKSRARVTALGARPYHQLALYERTIAPVETCV